MNDTLQTEKIIEELNEVLQVDLDAVGAYQAAMQSIRETNIVSALAGFKADHERHVSELQALVRRYGGRPKEDADLAGLLKKGLTRLAGVVGTEACLRAMLMNEKQANDVYGRHLAKPFPEEVLAVLRRGADDERRHYDWIDHAIAERRWEEQPTISG